MSFGWMTTFRTGQWKAFRKFSLEERKSVEARVRHINAQLTRIGEITVLYETQEDEDGNITATERRTGFSVSSGSTLEKLIQAYVVQGGNPLDISMFLSPDRVTVQRKSSGQETFVSPQPSFGVVYPVSSEFYQGPIYEGGFASILKYPPRRMGGRKDPGDGTDAISSRVDAAKKWIRQEIRHKRNLPEERIKKLCDLREQLIQERDEIITQAVGGTVAYIADRFDSIFSESFTLPQVVQAIDSIFFVESQDVPNDFDLTSVNVEALARQPTLYPDDEDGQEDNTAL
jgi:hypothetical protein